MELGHLKYFLVIKVAHRPEKIFLNQRKYTHLGCWELSRVCFLWNNIYHKLALATGNILSDSERHKRLIGQVDAIQIEQVAL